MDACVNGGSDEVVESTGIIVKTSSYFALVDCDLEFEILTFLASLF